MIRKIQIGLLFCLLSNPLFAATGVSCRTASHGKIYSYDFTPKGLGANASLTVDVFRGDPYDCGSSLGETTPTTDMPTPHPVPEELRSDFPDPPCVTFSKIASASYQGALVEDGSLWEFSTPSAEKMAVRLTLEGVIVEAQLPDSLVPSKLTRCHYYDIGTAGVTVHN